MMLVMVYARILAMCVSKSVQEGGKVIGKETMNQSDEHKHKQRTDIT